MNEIRAKSELRPATRRQFLAGAAAVGAAAVALSAGAGRANVPAMKPARGKAPTPPGANEIVNIGVIGVGGMGTGHVYSFADAANNEGVRARVAAVCDVNDLHVERAMKGLAERKVTDVKTYRAYKELLANPEIHGVVIATPEHAHAHVAMDAIMAGKDVYLEKPMTLRLDEALALRELVQMNSDKIFIVGTQKMILPKYIAAKKLIEDGGIGTPVMSQTSYCRNTPAGEWNYYEIDERWKPGANVDWDAWLAHLGPREWDPKVYIRWRRYRDFSTGIIGDLLVHEMTPMMMALESQGWPKRVTATGAHLVDKEMENHDLVNLTIEFESGHTLIVAGATCNETGLETMIRGSRANIYLNSRHCVVRPERPYVDDVDEQTVNCPDIGNDQQGLRMKWLEAIRTREQPPSTVDLGTRVMVAVDLATRSVWDGHSYEFDRSTMTAKRV